MDSSQLSLIWALPFLGLLLSIAFIPLLAPHFWQGHHGKVGAAWVAAFLVPFAFSFGMEAMGAEIAFVMLDEYIPFIILILALYTAGGGVVLRGTLVGTPLTNTVILAVGTILASVMGTTAAALLLIRPLLRANAQRTRKVHSFVFFIFLVANIGGSLTPIGDPPLYLGFLKGVSFFWPTANLFWPFLLCAGLLLGIYFLMDNWLYAREPVKPSLEGARVRLSIEGWVNMGLILVVVLGVLLQGFWSPGSTQVLGQAVAIERLVAIGIFVAVMGASLALTPQALRAANAFTWGAMAEVAKLFAAIFLCLAPVVAMLKAGPSGALAPLAALTSDANGAPIPWLYFWLTGGFSSFVDKAPTFLVFFNLAGGDPNFLMVQGAVTLAAISAGAVFMGAMTYIGSAPNFMVKAIAEENGVRMPSFFGYFGWACLFLVPLFVLCTLIFFV